MVPTPQECMKLTDRYGMPDNIRTHSLVVNKCALLIGHGLKASGIEVSVEKITAGALLHDIAKRLCLKNGGNHAARGREICIENNFHEIADIVGEHVCLSRYSSGGPIREKEIVYYADKRVNHDKVVSLDERLAYILRRYAKAKEDISRSILENFRLCKAVEQKLFARLPFRPQDLGDLVGEIKGWNCAYE